MQVNGKRSQRALSEKVGEIVKFWSAETSCWLKALKPPIPAALAMATRDNSFLSHVDRNLDTDSQFLLSTLPATKDGEISYKELMD